MSFITSRWAALLARRLFQVVALALLIGGLLLGQLWARRTRPLWRHGTARPGMALGALAALVGIGAFTLLRPALGDVTARAPWTVMGNVLGGEATDLYPTYRHLMARDPELKVHLYGKGVRPGRKIGHVNVSGSDLADLRERARHAADYIQGVIDE